MKRLAISPVTLLYLQLKIFLYHSDLDKKVYFALIEPPNGEQQVSTKLRGFFPSERLYRSLLEVILWILLIILIVGLFLDIVGAFFMFRFGPKVQLKTWIYNKSEQPKATKEEVKRNNLVKFGMILLMIGFSLQLISNFAGK